jgi:hypothetical protein
MPAEGTTGFDVEHLDAASRPQLIAANLTLEEAVAVARREAKRRGVGRMFRAGSLDLRDVIVITECSQES